ncbi:unnamed protein product [Lactuca virosa]|uniref:Uncharacterized protein n=1 Tax=Lactuca virosa TaxID=75947 RepID=A0AAU9MPY2_9ASTR|nr:unnamed protein product [Lactuca virosa]
MKKVMIMKKSKMQKEKNIVDEEKYEGKKEDVKDVLDSKTKNHHPDMTENTAKDEGKKDLVKDMLDPKRKSHPKISNLGISTTNQNKESLPELTEQLPELTENQNLTQEPRQQRKKKPAEKKFLVIRLFNLQGSVYDQLLLTINKRVVFRYVFESLFPGEYLFSDVIDSWSELLNYNEKDRDINNSPYIVFLSVQMTTNYIEDEQLPKPKKDDKKKRMTKRKGLTKK